MNIASLPTLAALEFGSIQLDPGGCFSWVLAGALAGWLATLLVRGHSFGCLGNIALGLVGAVVGLIILSFLPIHFEGVYHFLGTLLVAFVGAFVLAALGRLIGGSSRSRYYH